MPDMKYNGDVLRTGSTHAETSSESANSAATTLQGASGGGSPYGNVSGADSLHGAVGVAQQHHALNADRTSKNMHVAAQRATGTAALGDANTDETTAVASRSNQARAVSDGM